MLLNICKYVGLPYIPKFKNTLNSTVPNIWQHILLEVTVNLCVFKWFGVLAVLDHQFSQCLLSVMGSYKARRRQSKYKQILKNELGIDFKEEPSKVIINKLYFCVRHLLLISNCIAPGCLFLANFLMTN